MKLYAMSELLREVDSRYLLVNAVAHRAREIAVQAEIDGVSLEEKPVTLAMEEACQGTLVIPSLQNQQKEAGESEDQAENNVENKAESLSE